MEYFLISATLNKAFVLSKNAVLGIFFTSTLSEHWDNVCFFLFKKKKEKLMINQLLKENVGSVSQ